MLIKCIDGPMEGQFIDSDLDFFKVANLDFLQYQSRLVEITYKKHKFVGQNKTFYFFSAYDIDEALSRVFEHVK